MGYAVLHLAKASGSDAGMSAHIERTIEPKNADATRTHLNKELVVFPPGVINRTQAIQHRIEHAGIQRKIGSNQVKAIRVLLSGSAENMKQLEQQGQLDNWCRHNLEWLKSTYGSNNLVSAVLHLDETTPHIHATIVPIVTGERRKAQPSSSKKYKKKHTNAVRLCADDVMCRTKLKEYQNSYAAAMKMYGLNRGIEGSTAKHISTSQYYRTLFAEKENLKQDVEDIYLHRDEAKEKFLAMDEYVKGAEAKLVRVKQQLQPYEGREDLAIVYELNPEMKERVQVAKYCMKVGFKMEHIKHLFAGKELKIGAGKLVSPEHRKLLEVKNVCVKIGDSKLLLNGVVADVWFRDRVRELQGVGRGRRM